MNFRPHEVFIFLTMNPYRRSAKQKEEGEKTAMAMVNDCRKYRVVYLLRPHSLLTLTCQKMMMGK